MRWGQMACSDSQWWSLSFPKEVQCGLHKVVPLSACCCPGAPIVTRQMIQLEQGGKGQEWGARKCAASLGEEGEGGRAGKLRWVGGDPGNLVCRRHSRRAEIGLMDSR